VRSMRRSLVLSAVAALLLSPCAFAQEVPNKLPEVASKAFKHPSLDIQTRDLEVKSLATRAADEVRGGLVALGAPEASTRIDHLSGRFTTLLPAVPMVPGTGVGNSLKWSDVGLVANDRESREKSAMDAFVNYLTVNRSVLGIDLSELKAGRRIASHDNGIYQIFLPRSIDGIAVRGSWISGFISHGNLILMNTHQWGDRPAAPTARQISTQEALQSVYSHLYPLNGQFSGKGEKVYLTTVGANGYDYKLAVVLKGTIDGDGGNWEALVNATTGELLSLEDTNHYAEAKGGVLPVSNDGIAPDGVEQAGWPMPFMTVTGGTTDTGGNAAVSGSLTASLSGTYVRMTDACGTISLTQTDNLNFGTSGGTDCVTPGIGGAGNTHASRSGFYELNRIKESARAQLPSNTWLTGQLVSNMNINLTCNANWSGTQVNFYRSGGGCNNTGEIAGVFDHEFGHGMDDNDANGNIAGPSGEGIADIYAAIRLNTSCIGRNFRTTVCTGFGDPCDTCTGVRDIDYLARQSNLPHTYTWSNANCGGSVHCVGAVYAEAVWSLWKRKLQSAPFNMDNNTSMEVVTRLSYIGAGSVGTWFSGGPPNGGCAGGSGYLNYLAADDDNGNINDGTPHMSAIHSAFNEQQIACTTPAVVNSGCANTPTAQPNVTATAGAGSVSLSWGAVTNATKYQVFRTEGVFGCDFGKAKIGETTGTSFSSTNLQAGRSYSYTVIPIGAANTCMGPASACDSATPTAPAAAVTVYFDNFETATGWTTNPSGTDTATAGAWERGDPEATTSSGAKQLGTTVSGTNDLVTARLAGASAGANDVDGGVTSIRSPLIALPATGTLTLSFSQYLAHGSNSSTADYLRVFVVGSSTTQVFQKLGTNSNVNGVWATATANISSFAGQSVRILIEAADASGASLVEAGIDDVKIVQQ
jgi:trimeric autotransporter adhesin